MNYDAFIERDVDGIRSSIAEFRRDHSSHDLFLGVTRFAVLAYAPSQHSKHALLACLSAYDAREDAGDRWDELLTECAIYAAQSRQPWSEPPMLDPPKLEADQRQDVDELRAAVDTLDRLRGELWLAARIDDPNLRDDFFEVAADDFEDQGHKLIVANACWRLSEILGAKGRFAMLRVGVWEMTAYKGERYVPRGGEVDRAALLDRIVTNANDIESLHRAFLFDAANGNARAMDYLDVTSPSSGLRPPSPRAAGRRATGAGSPSPREAGRGRHGAERSAGEGRVPIYPLAKDYGATLKSYVIAKRLNAPNLLEAAKRNLQTGPSFDEWSFA